MKKGAAVLMAIVAAVAVIGIVLVFNGGSLTGAQVVEQNVICTGCTEGFAQQEHICSDGTSRGDANIANWERDRDRDGCTTPCDFSACTTTVELVINSAANLCCRCLDAAAVASPQCKTACQQSFAQRGLPSWPVLLTTLSNTDTPAEPGNGIPVECNSESSTLARIGLFEWLEDDFLAIDQQSCAQCVTTCAPTCTSQADCESQLGEFARCSGLPSNSGSMFPENTGRCIQVCDSDLIGDCGGGSLVTTCVKLLFGADDVGPDDGLCCAVASPTPTPTATATTAPTLPPLPSIGPIATPTAIPGSTDEPEPTPTPTLLPFCGDGRVTPPEECDKAEPGTGGQCSVAECGFTCQCPTPTPTATPSPTPVCGVGDPCEPPGGCGTGTCLFTTKTCIC